MTAEYTKSVDPESNVTTFVVTPSKAPIPTMPVIMSVIGIFLPPLLLIGVPLLLWQWKGPKARKYRSSSTICASKHIIGKVGEPSINTKDMHRLIIRNHISDVVVVGGGPMNQKIELSRLKKLESVSYRLEVEANGKPTTLAGGLTEAAAYGLMRDIGPIVGLK